LQSFLHKLAKYVGKLPTWAIVALFIAVALAATIFLELWSQVRETPTTGQPGIMVFETGGGSIVLTIFLPLMGLAFVCGGLWFLWVLGRNFMEEVKHGGLINELKDSWMLLVALLVFILGAFMLYMGTWENPHSERIVIDKAPETIEIEKYYLLRHETELVSFRDIRHIKYVVVRDYSVPGSPPSKGKVMLVTYDGKEVEVSEDGARPHHELARAISDATGKPLMD